MSVIRVLKLRCDTCGAEEHGADPRYSVRALRRRLQAEGWHVSQGAQGGPGLDICAACLKRGRRRPLVPGDPS